MPVLMTQAEFAQRHGVGKPAVTRWKKLNLLVFAPDPERPDKQLVDAEKSDLLVRASVDPTRGRPRAVDQAQVQLQGEATEVPSPRAAPAMSGMEAARLEEMQERTRRRRIETEQLLGTLVPIAEYERRAGDLGRRCREGVHAIIRQQAERLAAESDPREIAALLAGECDGLFDRLSAEIEAEATREREVDAQLAPLAEDDDEAEA